MGTTVGRATARAALAGNPSDGFGGAVLATPVPDLVATVEVADGDEVIVGDRRWSSPPAVVGPHHDETALLSATVERLVAWCGTDGPGVPDDGMRLTWSTTIPRSVGLAGSSALVIAAIRALAPRWGLDPDGDLDVLTTARLALEVEVDLLGIAAGPQDRLVQAAATTLLMDFGGPAWAFEALCAPAPVSLFVAWSDAAQTPSQAVHSPLQARRDEPLVRDSMACLAGFARSGADALRSGDLDGLAAAMDGSYELRGSMLALEPAHVALVEGARACGAAANYTGSGGAVVGLAAEAQVLDAVRTWVAEAGLGMVAVEVPNRSGVPAPRDPARSHSGTERGAADRPTGAAGR